MGALIGGFALASLQSTDFVPDTLGRAIYMTSFLGVHGCTCAAVTTALLGRRANLLKDDEEAAAWAAAHPWLLLLPFAKFMVGCGAYLISVLLISWRDLAGDGTQLVALFIGAGSVSVTAGVHAMLTS